jgi:hypothetical protein
LADHNLKTSTSQVRHLHLTVSGLAFGGLSKIHLSIPTKGYLKIKMFLFSRQPAYVYLLLVAAVYTKFLSLRLL